MTLDEIQELLDLKDWSKTRLAAELDMSEASVWRWFRDSKPPSGPAALLIRQWLSEARGANGQAGKPNGKRVAAGSK